MDWELSGTFSEPVASQVCGRLADAYAAASTAGAGPYT